jgi:hypothetical protein
MTRVFLNLFSNGFYATTKRARDGVDAHFVPTLKVITRDAGETVEIRVWDNRTGIPADITDKLFLHLGREAYVEHRPVSPAALPLAIRSLAEERTAGHRDDDPRHDDEYRQGHCRFPQLRSNGESSVEVGARSEMIHTATGHGLNSATTRPGGGGRKSLASTKPS